jgi:hypothetical protein
MNKQSALWILAVSFVDLQSPITIVTKGENVDVDGGSTRWVGLKKDWISAVAEALRDPRYICRISGMGPVERAATTLYAKMPDGSLVAIPVGDERREELIALAKAWLDDSPTTAVSLYSDRECTRAVDTINPYD